MFSPIPHARPGAGDRRAPDDVEPRVAPRKNDFGPVRRKRGLGFVRGIVRETQRVGAADRLNPDVEPTRASAIGRIREKTSVGRKSGIDIETGGRRQPDQVRGAAARNDDGNRAEASRAATRIAATDAPTIHHRGSRPAPRFASAVGSRIGVGGIAVSPWAGVDALRVQLPDEPIAAPRQRLDESRCRRRIAEGFTKSLDGRVQAVLEIDERVFRPELVTQVVACDRGPRVAAP